MDKKQVSALSAAAVVVATMAAVAATLLSASGDPAPRRDTVPVGQLVDVPVSTTPGSSLVPPAVVTEPVQKDAIVTNPPAPQTAAQQPAPATEEPAEPTHPPFVPTTEGETAPAPPPPAPCYWDDSDPVNFPNGREICP